jgi:hypothetical protein
MRSKYINIRNAIVFLEAGGRYTRAGYKNPEHDGCPFIYQPGWDCDKCPVRNTEPCPNRCGFQWPEKKNKERILEILNIWAEEEVRKNSSKTKKIK